MNSRWQTLNGFRKAIILMIFLLSGALMQSCFEDQDDNFVASSTTDINEFIWRGLNYFYLYKADIPALQDNAFASEQERRDFLADFLTPEDCFAGLKSNQDPFSILVDDYLDLENALSGVRLTNGMIYGLVYYPNDASRVFGYVRYVLPNSDAAQQEVVRGMIFSSVDGVQLSDTNYTDLLDTDSYILSWATYDGITVSPTGATTSLVKTQQTQNPIQLRQVLEINGQKIGYLMYNAFTNEFDQALNNVFADFAAQGISDLVLDLRYNGGGSVKTATYLSGMITGQFNGQIFYNEQWNSDRQQIYASPGLFVNQMDNGTALNTLGLNRVYVLTSPSTASASELVINGLTPYIEVVQIGTATRGKFQASFLLYDAPAPSFTRSLANTGHRYAMLPLVFKTLNAAGVTDYADGLVPDIELSESFDNLGMLGTLSEPLLAQAIAEITGIPQPQQRTSSAREYTRTDDPWNALMYR